MGFFAVELVGAGDGLSDAESNGLIDWQPAASNKANTARLDVAGANRARRDDRMRIPIEWVIGLVDRPRADFADRRESSLAGSIQRHRWAYRLGLSGSMNRITADECMGGYRRIKR